MTAEKTRTAKTETSPPASSRLARTGRAKKIVAITGAASFLGTNLVGLLEEDERIGRIVAIDIKPPSTAGSETRSYEVDLTQPTAEARLARFSRPSASTRSSTSRSSRRPRTRIAWAHELESGRHDARPRRRAARVGCASS